MDNIHSQVQMGREIGWNELLFGELSLMKIRGGLYLLSLWLNSVCLYLQIIWATGL